MARKSASTDAPRPKRQKGFAVTIKGFIPMGDDIPAQIATLQLIDGSETVEVVKAMTGVEVVSKQTSRVVSDAA